MIRSLFRIYIFSFVICLSFSRLWGTEGYFNGVLTYNYAETGTGVVDKPESKVIFYIKYPWIKKVYMSPINQLEIAALINLKEKKYYQVFKEFLISEKSLGDPKNESKYAEYLKHSQVELFQKDEGVQITNADEAVDIIIVENKDLYFPYFYDQFSFSFLLDSYFDDIDYIPEELYYKFGDTVCRYELQKVVRTTLDDGVFAIPAKTAEKGWKNRGHNEAQINQR